MSSRAVLLSRLLQNPGKIALTNNLDWLYFLVTNQQDASCGDEASSMVWTKKDKNLYPSYCGSGSPVLACWGICWYSGAVQSSKTHPPVPTAASNPP